MTTITLPRAIVEQAQEALDEATNYTSCPTWSPSMTEKCKVAASALRAALAEPVQEPQRTPLHEDEIHDLLEAEFLGGYGMRSWDDDLQVFRLAEQAHGIKEGT